MEKQYHQIYQYIAVFESDKKMGGYSVTIPALPGCISEGDTFEEALKNIQEAAELYLEDCKNNSNMPFENDAIVAPIKVRVWNGRAFT